MPWLADLIDKSPRLQALVQNTMPTLALIMFNGLLPFFLECEFGVPRLSSPQVLCYEQGFRSRSSAEYSLTKK